MSIWRQLQIWRQMQIHTHKKQYKKQGENKQSFFKGWGNGRQTKQNRTDARKISPIPKYAGPSSISISTSKNKPISIPKPKLPTNT